jgi:RNA polymerase sigma-70 factor, ECF subfamily
MPHAAAITRRRSAATRSRSDHALVTTPYQLPQHGPEWSARIRAGDERAFEALFRALAPGLCVAVVRYVGSRAVAEELVQELFFELWAGRSTLAIEGSISGYLFTAARHRALNHLRRERRIVPDPDDAFRASAADPAAATESELLDALELQDAIDHLPARCRLIFTLSRRQDMTYGEIASSLGLSIKTVETQMGRALKSLRDRLRHLLP